MVSSFRRFYLNSAQAIELTLKSGYSVLPAQAFGMSIMVAPTAMILPIWLVVLCIGAILFIQLTVSPFVMLKVVRPIATTHPLLAVLLSSAMVAISANTVSAMWLAALLAGSQVALFFGALAVLACTIIAVIYFAAVPAWFLAAMAPSILGWAIVPFFYLSGAAPWLVALGLANVMFLIRAAWRDRNDLMDAVKEEARQRADAEKANFEKSRFLATMSHELRTPLNAVIGYAEILEEELLASERVDCAADAARINRSAKSLLSLINEVLDLSKIEAGKMEIRPAETDIAFLVRETVEVCRPLAGQNQNALSVILPEKIPPLVVDQNRLRQCLLNLVSNACKFTKNGAVRVDVAWRPMNGGVLSITVIDTGCGISEEAAPKLFSPFFQIEDSSTRTHGGTGLGLAITRRLAKLMGGDVSMTSVVGEGTNFVLTVAARESTLAESGEGPTILVVDDDLVAQDLFRRAGGALPFRMIFASTAEQGRKLAELVRPVLIVIDIHLPDMDGWRLMSELKQSPHLEHTPMIVISTDDDRNRSFAHGALEHLVKPVDRDLLMATLMRHTGHPVRDAGDAALRQKPAAA